MTFGLLALTIGMVPATLAGITLVAGATLPGAALVRVLLPRPTLLHLVVLGTVFGLGLWALGGLLSHVTALYAVRWVPSVLALAVWALPRTCRRISGIFLPTTPPVVSLGAFAGLVALFPALRATLASQPSAWSGWWTHYPDLGFQVAIAGEVARRVPFEASWVAGTPLSYTWTFHSAMGVWSSTSTVSAADLVLQVWPALFTILIPAVIAILAWELSRSTTVAAIAPVVYSLAHGLIIAPPAFVQLPLYPVSPTRDFGHLFLAVVLICLVRLLGRRSTRALHPGWLAALLLAMIVAAGSKGSELPVLLGGVLFAGFVLVVRRRVSLVDFITLAVFGAASAVGLLVTLPDSGSAQTLMYGPLSFLGNDAPTRPMEAVGLVVLLATSILGFWVTMGRRGTWLVSSVMSGTMLAGLVGLALLTQNGGSQNYFWQAVEPLVAVSLAWCGTIVARRFGLRVLLAAGAVLLGASVVRMSTGSPALLTAAIVTLAAAAAVFTLVRPGTRVTARAICSAPVLTLLLVQAAQIIGISAGTTGGFASTEADPGAVEASQLQALEFIGATAPADAIIVTNAHCYVGSIADDDCDARHFTVTAFSERRVLVEGWSYTQNGLGDEWVTDQVALSSTFLEHPTDQGAQQLQQLGVDWVYVDTREPFSDDLDTVATRVFQSPWALVYRLD